MAGIQLKNKNEYEAKKEEEKVITLDELKPILVAKAREGKSDQVKAYLTSTAITNYLKLILKTTKQFLMKQRCSNA